MILVTLASLAIQTPPANPEWVAATGDDTTAAVLMYGQGQSLSVFCRDARLQLLVGGLPATAEPTRTLQVNLKGSELKDSNWIMGSDQTTAISTAPAIYARHFRRGGVFVVRVPPEGEARGRRYELPLPSDSAALDRVLDACDQPLERAEDARYDPATPLLRWVERPLASYPDEAFRRGVGAGEVNLTCITRSDGALRDCVINSEEPNGRGFGRAALAATRKARLDTINGGPITEGQTATFTIRYAIAAR